MSISEIEQCEYEIDESFANNSLNDVSYSQALWTILSVMDDIFLKFMFIDGLPSEQRHIYSDIYLNALTYPLRSVFIKNKQFSGILKSNLIDNHYAWAYDWIRKAEVYDGFNSIFPLWRKKKIELEVDINSRRLNINIYRNNKLDYEAYNRLHRKDGLRNEKPKYNSNIIPILLANTSYSQSGFKLNLNPGLVKFLVDEHSLIINEQYRLPSDWECSLFTFGDFKKVFVTLQSILYGRFIIRSFLAMQGMHGLGYSDSVWVISFSELMARLYRYTAVKKEKLEAIIKYLIFGNMDIRKPDIAIQPIIDLRNGYLAMSTFVFMNTDSERNLCVLLNQIEADRKIYSRLTQRKEESMRFSLEKEVKNLGYEVAYGNLGDTDLDFAIIDRKEKACIAFELKWFIEPAEIREVIQRSEELQKGVSQALKILKKFNENNKRLIKNVLCIDEHYDFRVAVGSRNWIGHFDVQCPQVPIIKIGHFVEELRARGSLKLAIEWLLNREYLPRLLINYEVMEIPLELGNWVSTWYGIKPKTSDG